MGTRKIRNCNNCWWYCHSDGYCYPDGYKVGIPKHSDTACEKWHSDGLTDTERRQLVVLSLMEKNK